jgi:hypothetical protein
MKRNALPPTSFSFRNVQLADLDSPEAACPWLWHGYLAPGNVTLLTSLWKSGKTTLASVLLTRLGTGGALAGLAVRPGKAVIVSEESIQHWRMRKEKFAFGPHIVWICRPFRGRPTLDGWLALMDHLLDLRREQGLDLVVIDPLAEFLPGRSESEAGAVLDALAPLARLTDAGLAVWLLHHPRKKGGPGSLWARGSGVLTAHADILMEMSYYASAADPDRRRTILAWSRFDATPRGRVIELTAAGTDYRSLGDLEEEAFTNGWQVVQHILDSADQKLTRRDILGQWPAPSLPPAETTLWHWLDRAVGQGLIRCSGSGHRNDPFRYWNASLEQKWADDPVLALLAGQEEARREVGLGRE